MIVVRLIKLNLNLVDILPTAWYKREVWASTLALARTAPGSIISRAVPTHCYLNAREIITIFNF